MLLDQNKAPIYEALVKYNDMRVVPFDVPGHKHGKGNPELTDFLGQTCMNVDVNSMKPLDNLCHPVSVIRRAEELAAEAFGAGHCFFMVNGTTSSVQSMILSVCKEGDKIIIPRNVHRSAINALIISGVLPVYVDPGVDMKLGIPLGMSIKDVERAIKENPDAKAVFVNNPTYYGICSDLSKITRMAHAHGMKVLVDEAHGTHLYFGANMPINAMAAGADMAAVSMHKTGGSLTQSSFLLVGKKAGISEGHVRAIINLTQTTSGSYLLLSSLDIARKYYATHGRELCAQVVKSAEYARAEVNRIGGYYAYSDELVNGDSIFAFDKTKLSIYTRDVGLEGIEVYDKLRDLYDIQMELGDLGNVLAIISPGDRWKDIERLVSALAEIKRRYGDESKASLGHEYINPQIVISPKEAFYGEQESIPLMQSAGRISCEFVMCYPPGIPIIAPG
ncbi:MAG: aminotransferase class V-fold PLP-dependent enzyme, partial [Oscillospiraceae bacterium]|nr:aminotransferase class V-fold PLP-dependent enzyme [Oscillospiraceae bacterium]